MYGGIGRESWQWELDVVVVVVVVIVVAVVNNGAPSVFIQFYLSRLYDLCHVGSSRSHLIMHGF